jgi:hypothetical protein
VDEQPANCRDDSHNLADAQRVMEQRHVRRLPVMQCPAFAYRSARDVGTSHDEPALL